MHSTKKYRQYESHKVNNTATKHSLCPGNWVFAHEKFFIFVFCFNNKTTTLKKHKKTF